VLQFYIPPEYRCFNFCPNFVKDLKPCLFQAVCSFSLRNQIYHRLDGEVADLFALEDEITRRIAIALGIELIDREAARPTRYPDAFDYILRGSAVMSAPKTRKTYAVAISLFDRALALDPRTVEAQSFLAIRLAGHVTADVTDTAAADMARAEAFGRASCCRIARSALAHMAQAIVLRA
jgi:adenylate cyclase